MLSSTVVNQVVSSSFKTSSGSAHRSSFAQCLEVTSSIASQKTESGVGRTCRTNCLAFSHLLGRFGTHLRQCSKLKHCALNAMQPPDSLGCAASAVATGVRWGVPLQEHLSSPAKSVSRPKHIIDILYLYISHTQRP